jgi:hypothetical protein
LRNSTLPSPQSGYGISQFDSGDRHVFHLPSRTLAEKFRDSAGNRNCDSMPLANGRGAAMSYDEGFEIGYFGDVRRQRVGAEIGWGRRFFSA